MNGTSRRDFLRNGAGSICCATSLLLAGCSLRQHHRPYVKFWNEDTTEHDVSVTIQRSNGETVFDRSRNLQPDESVDYTDALPRPADTADDVIELETTVSLDSGTSKRVTDKLTPGSHGLDIHIMSAESIKVIQSVH